MGLGSALLGAAVGAGAVFFILKQQAEAEVPPEPIVLLTPVEDFVDVNVDPLQIDPDRWSFEVEYRNRSDMRLRLDAIFEVRDLQGATVFTQRKSLNINPGSTFQIFWDTGNLTAIQNVTGDFFAIFTTEERGTLDPLSRPETIIFPVA